MSSNRSGRTGCGSVSGISVTIAAISSIGGIACSPMIAIVTFL